MKKYSGILLRYIRWQFRLANRKGHGIHSPFIYNLVSEAIHGPDGIDFAWIEDSRNRLKSQDTIIRIEDYGAGNRLNRGEERRLSEIVRFTAMKPATGRLLARLLLFFKPDEVIELGTGTGIGTLYMAVSVPDTRIISCEGSPGIAHVAASVFKDKKLLNIDLITGKFQDLLPGLLNKAGKKLFVVIDGDHRASSLVTYVDMILDKAGDRSVIFIDDINWSEEMYRCWKKLCLDRRIELSLDLFHLGILVLNKDLHKQHLDIKYP